MFPLFISYKSIFVEVQKSKFSHISLLYVMHFSVSLSVIRYDPEANLAVCTSLCDFLSANTDSLKRISIATQ